MTFQARLRLIAVGMLVLSSGVAAAPVSDLASLEAAFAAQVDRRVEVPGSEIATYSRLLSAALAEEGIAELTPQFIVVVDRNPRVQVLMLLWAGSGEEPRLIGATYASTGRPGRYEHFVTPLGVFRHVPGNTDFRAEGTVNDEGIRGYGAAGMRVYDFGWQPGRRSWDRHGASLLRLQMHSTDPDMLEPRVGTRQSKGCIRIPATLNRFLDHYGILDAGYEKALRMGMKLPVLAADREPAAGAGRYLVIVDSGRESRPSWSPAPGASPH